MFKIKFLTTFTHFRISEYSNEVTLNESLLSLISSHHKEEICPILLEKCPYTGFKIVNKIEMKVGMQ